MRAPWAWILWLCSVATHASAQAALVVEALECRGNTRTSCEFILGHIYLAPGEALDEAELDNGRLRLAAAPMFDGVRIYLEKGQSRGHARIVVEVQEADPLSKEAVLGVSSRIDSLGAVLTGRLSHQNLFGAGEILDGEVTTRVPLDGPRRDALYARLQYVDPAWFDSHRYFLLGGVGFLDNAIENRFGDYYEYRRFSADLAVGRRIFDFSYVLLEYQERFGGRFRMGERTREGGFNVEDVKFDYGILYLGYGWNSEDDPFFPTQGSRLSTSLGWVPTVDEFYLSVAYRKTWRTDEGSLWSFRVGGSPGTKYRLSQDESLGFTASYGRALPNAERFAARRARWYVELGASDAVGYPDWDRPVEIGIKTGVRLDLPSFGIVDLYFIGSGELHTQSRGNSEVRTGGNP